MILIGLTGGVGMGKSVAADLLGRRGIPVTDTDALARELVRPGQPALEEIERIFGPEVIDRDRGLRRDELARRVFADPTRRKQLEAILHPRIRQQWRATAATWRAQNHPRGCVVIPLLFETSAAPEFDAVICIACSAATQRQRLLARGWSAPEMEQRIQAQWPIEQKLAAAPYVVWTEGSLEIHAAQLDRILEGLSPA